MGWEFLLTCLTIVLTLLGLYHSQFTKLLKQIGCEHFCGVGKWLIGAKLGWIYLVGLYSILSGG